MARATTMPQHTYNLMVALERLSSSGATFGATNLPGSPVDALRIYERLPDAMFAGKRVRALRITISDAWERSVRKAYYAKSNGQFLGGIACGYSSTVVKIPHFPSQLTLGQHGIGGTVASYPSSNFTGFPTFYDYTWTIEPDLVNENDVFYCETAHESASYATAPKAMPYCFELSPQNVIEGIRTGGGRAAQYLARRK